MNLLVDARAPDADWRKAWRLAFAQLRDEVDLQPGGATPAAVFEAAARTARVAGEECLPLAMGLVMHLYPLCALRCVPLPGWSVSNYRRHRLLRTIEGKGLILANAGSERVSGLQPSVTVKRTDAGVLVDGVFDYVSLANVADLVLFSAPLPDGAALFCIADLRAGTARIGPPCFKGTMRLTDTCSLAFDGHLVPDGRFVVIPNGTSFDCMTRYQRSWFQLLAAEAHLARLEFLRKRWKLPRSAEETLSFHELALLRKFSLRLLDDAKQRLSIEQLAGVASAIKLRVSWHCQTLAATLEEWDAIAAAELRHLARQPVADERILRGITETSVSQPLVIGQRRCAIRSGLAGRSHAAKAAT